MEQVLEESSRFKVYLGQPRFQKTFKKPKKSTQKQFLLFCQKHFPYILGNGTF